MEEKYLLYYREFQSQDEVRYRIEILSEDSSMVAKEVQLSADSPWWYLCNAFDKDIDNVKIQLDKVNDNLTKINSLLLLKYKDASKVFSVKNSPRKLNEIGEKVYADINGAKFLDTNEEFLFSLIDAYHPKTALDVENAAHAVCAVSTENEIFNEIKNFVYNSPSYKMPDDKLYDLTLPDICFVLSLPLRDRYLNAHPEIVTE